MKKYVRCVIDLPNGQTIREAWSESTEEGAREMNFVSVYNQVIQGQQGFIKLVTKSGNIEIIPGNILKDSYARIEYSHFKFL